MKPLRRKVAITGGVLLCLVGVVIFFHFDPSGEKWFPRCVFFTLTGFKCPGCGSQRAIHSLLHLDFCQAFRYNGLLFLLIPYMAMLLISGIFKSKMERLYQALTKPAVIYILLVVILLWWLLRNIFGW